MNDHRKADKATTADEAALAPFFLAARAGAPEPPLPLLTAILADAAEARSPAPAAPAPVRRGRLAPAFGVWRGAAALAACALLGFWLGLAGGVTVDGATLRAVAASAADDGDPIETFLDLAAME